ncbi:MAG TPA: hypothetical protein VFO77_11135 [Actinoplanes sp.]|nr:hypothetical protein [Actinoplanes sp.]
MTLSSMVMTRPDRVTVTELALPLPARYSTLVELYTLATPVEAA